MEETVYNPQKGRLETIDIEYTDKNTTWFDNCRTAQDIYTITDFKGGILIREYGYTHPFWIYDVSRTGINHDQMKAKELRKQYL